MGWSSMDQELAERDKEWELVIAELEFELSTAKAEAEKMRSACEKECRRIAAEFVKEGRPTQSRDYSMLAQGAFACVAAIRALKEVKPSLPDQAPDLRGYSEDKDNG